jgi:L-iditol 2-dehydrogenase
LPDEVSSEEGTFVEPLGCCLRGVRLAGFQPGWAVLVLGSGISGLLNISLAVAFGASRVIATDVNQYRLDAAKRLGADAAIHAEEDLVTFLRDKNEGRLADLVIVSTGATSAFAQALSCVDRGGTVLLFAPPEPGVQLNLPGWDFWRDQITLISTYAASPLDMETAIELIHAGRVPVEDMITHRLSLAEAQLGFQLVAEAQDSIKVIIEPHR